MYMGVSWRKGLTKVLVMKVSWYPMLASKIVRPVYTRFYVQHHHSRVVCDVLLLHKIKSAGNWASRNEGLSPPNLK